MRSLAPLAICSKILSTFSGPFRALDAPTVLWAPILDAPHEILRTVITECKGGPCRPVRAGRCCRSWTFRPISGLWSQGRYDADEFARPYTASRLAIRPKAAGRTYGSAMPRSSSLRQVRPSRHATARHPPARRGTYHPMHPQTIAGEGDPRAERAFRLAAARAGAIFPGFFSVT